MKTKGFILEAACIAVGLLGLGLFVYCGMTEFKEMDNTVSVKGSGRARGEGRQGHLATHLQGVGQ